MKVVKLLIGDYKERQDLVFALASNGYKVWIEETASSTKLMGSDYYVCFEIPENCISTDNKEEE